jgi:UDPglucose--hexose-1-phosphate uridylyltransferase
MEELRWNPIRQEWVIVATHRQTRPLLSRKQCPFCEEVEGAPRELEVISIPNLFPSLLENSRSVSNESPLFAKCPAYGKCEVVIYSKDHDKGLKDQSADSLIELINLWIDRYEELGSKPGIKYVFIFENKGRLIGVTLDHPHGQIYAFPFVPEAIQREVESSKKWMEKHGRCLFCSIIEGEEEKSERIIFENERFVGFVPFFASLPYEVHLYPKSHLGSITQLDDHGKKDLAESIKAIITKYDRFFGFELPYMMMLFQSPTDGKGYPFYHFRIEFRPLHRSKEKIKYLASVESGTGVFINDTLPEEKARELKKTKWKE